MNKDKYIGQIINEKYIIKNVITKGGMNSTIYEAEAVQYDSGNYFDSKIKRAAIKIIERSADVPDDLWQRINDEVVTLSRMSKKRNVIKLYDAIVNDECIIIIMELVDGSSLEDKILEYGRFSLGESIFLFKEILIGVGQLHDNSLEIIHRDLKPANILLLKNETEIRIIDFGISSVFDKTVTEDAPQVITNEESFFGTLTYVTPDILGCRNVKFSEFYKKVTRQFDFHSLGIVFHEMITGEKPLMYENEEDPKCLSFYLEYDMPPMKWSLPNIPNEIENIIFKLTASKPEHLKYRYKNIREIMSDIFAYEKKTCNKLVESQLLNPITSRVFQKKQIFDVKVDKLRLSGKKWIIISSGIGLLITIILLIATVLLWTIR